MKVKITPEIDLWLEKNVNNYLEWNDIIKYLKNNFGVEVKQCSLINHCKSRNIIKIKQDKVFDKQQAEWLKENRDNYTIEEIIIELQKRFNIKRNSLQISRWFKRNNVYKNLTGFSKQEEQWIKDNAYLFDNTAEMCKEFNLVFNNNKTNFEIRRYLKNHKIICVNKYFTKEQLDFIQENLKDNYLEDFAKIYNQKFNENRKAISFSGLISRGIIKKEKNNHSLNNLLGYNLKTKLELNDEEKEWLIQNNKKYKSNQLFKIYKCKFNKAIHFSTFKKLLERNNISFIKRKRPALPTEESKRWCIENYKKYYENNYFNHQKMYEDFEELFEFGMVKKSFIKFLKKFCNIDFDYKTQLIHGINNKYEIGFERMIHNHVYIRLSNEKCLYRKKENVLYEQYYNIKIDDKKQYVIFLNGNNQDFSKDNLYLSDLKDFRTYQNRYISKNSNLALKPDKKLRKIAIMNVQLENIIKEVRYEQRNK